ncbi:sugar transferase [Marinicrinis sediminis]|uniref:Sugar transferase n=1 Tax=Marinicrinis sediminis TaxID=1652465 RepID=A0ABW5RCF8_9BACL
MREKRKEKRSYRVWKRMTDIGLSTAGLIILFPLFVVIAILIKWDDPKGAVLFKQVRIGKNGKTFFIYKFRTMISNAESMLEQLKDKNEVSGAMFKMKKDPRVTRVGRVLRKTSLDELPQLINVWRGEMSMVGPRPPLPNEVATYTAYEKRRLSITPGCTGLWQVNGRNSVGFEEMVAMDLTYIQQRSIWMDIKIMFKTFRVLFGSKDAY